MWKIAYISSHNVIWLEHLLLEVTGGLNWILWLLIASINLWKFVLTQIGRSLLKEWIRKNSLLLWLTFFMPPGVLRTILSIRVSEILKSLLVPLTVFLGIIALLLGLRRSTLARLRDEFKPLFGNPLRWIGLKSMWIWPIRSLVQL